MFVSHISVLNLASVVFSLTAAVEHHFMGQLFFRNLQLCLALGNISVVLAETLIYL